METGSNGLGGRNLLQETEDYAIENKLNDDCIESCDVV